MLCPPFLLVKDSHRLNMAPSMPNSGFLLYFCTSRGIKANCKRIVPLAFQFMCFHSCRITAELLVHYVIISIWWYKSKCCIHNPICRWKRAVIPRLGYLLLHPKPSWLFQKPTGLQSSLRCLSTSVTTWDCSRKQQRDQKCWCNRSCWEVAAH